MKSRIYHVGVAAIAVVSSMIGTLGIAEAKLQNAQLQEIQINSDALKNPQIPQINLAPSISGELEIVLGKYGGGVPKCKDVKVYLISEEYTEEPAPPPKPGEINLGSKKITYMFEYQGKISQNPKKASTSSAAYCNYSIFPGTKFVGKKATLGFLTGSVCSSNGDKITIPNAPIQKNYKEKICGIG
jgi:hypothetical protein